MSYNNFPETEVKNGRLYDGFFSDHFGERKYRKNAIWGSALALAIVVFSYIFSAPLAFPENTVFEVKSGESLNKVSANLGEKKIIKFPKLFRLAVYATGGQKKIKAGAYLFEDREWMFSVMARLTKGDGGFPLARVLIPEGLTVSEMSEVFSARLGEAFNAHTFREIAKSREGYLFPDTYHFSKNISAEEVVNFMNRNFQRKTADLEADLKRFGKPLSDVMIMASIVEEEAQTSDDRRKVAGILWKRLEIGMPLQVDAVFGYVLGKASLELTTDDLKKDSPYNTYTRLGLPPTPISNPGLESILASLNPTETKYFYYLSDKTGKIHYAVTHDEHVANKEKYLRRQ